MLDIIKTALVAVTTIINTLLPQPTYVEGMVGQPMEFNPLVNSGNEIDETIESLIFADLVDDLSESIEISEDGKEYTFHLKSGLKFHNGQEITADDVLYTLEQATSLTSLVRIKVDNSTIQIGLEKPFAPLLELLKIGIIPKDTDLSSLKLAPIGSGDFKIAAIKKAGTVGEITLEAVRGDYQIRKLVFKFFPTHRELTEAIKLGDVNGYGGLKILDWPNLTAYQQPLRGRYYGLFFNLNGPEILKDREFRRALAKALNKEVVVEQALDGQGAVINSPIEDSWASSDDISIYEFDEEPDVQYNNQLTLTVPATLPHLKAADIIKEYWSRVGVVIDIRPVPPQDMVEKIIKPKDFEVLLFGQEVGRDPDRYPHWHSTQQDLPGLNFTSYEQMRVDKALEEGRKTLNPEERKQHYANFQRVLTADAPVIYLYQPLYTFAVSKKISGINLDSFFYPQDRFLSLKDWKFE